MALRLLIADDNPLIRRGVRNLLKRKQDWEVCGEAENGREAIAKVSELSPDVIILDISMPVMNGLQAAEEIRGIAPATMIVFFSVHELPATAKKAGADVFVSKTKTGEALVTAIERLFEVQHSRAAAISGL